MKAAVLLRRQIHAPLSEVHARKSHTNTSNLLSELKACTSSRDLKTGRLLHARAMDNKHESNTSLANALVNMYAKCGSVSEAQTVFDNIPRPGVVPWTALMLGYVEDNQPNTALQLFTQMQSKGSVPDARAFVAALKACACKAANEEAKLHLGRLLKLDSLIQGTTIHEQVTKLGCEQDVFVASTLVDMYSKCGSMSSAKQVFDKMIYRNVVGYTSLILGYVENGDGKAALEVFRHMQCVPDALTFVAVFKSCTILAMKEDYTGSLKIKRNALEKGMEFHSEALKHGFDLHNNVLGNTLIDMYAKCGSLVDAQRVFVGMPRHNAVSWTTLMLGCVENGENELGLEYFKAMHREGCVPDALIVVAVIKACSSLASTKQMDTLEKGMSIHCKVLSFLGDIRVGNTLIDMYGKCSSIKDARMVFDKMPYRNLVSWNALLMAYAECGEFELILELFQTMEYDPDDLTVVAALKGSGGSGSLSVTIAMHAHYICRYGRLEYNEGLEELTNSLLDAYGKCGNVKRSQIVFDSVAKRSSVSWTALITGYSRLGETLLVFDMFEHMREEGLLPDRVLFMSMLAACSHSGHMEKGKSCFEAMSSKYGVRPEIQHYRCVVDMFARGNKLNEAVSMAQRLNNALAWRTVLGACWKWKNVEMGRVAFESLIALDESDDAAYVLMGNIYGSLGMWDEHSRVEGMRRRKHKRIHMS